MSRTILPLLGLLALAACATPELAPPGELPAALPAPAPSQSARVEAGLAIDRWWTLFGDAELDATISAALARNHDLAAAAARVRAARASLDEVHAARLPRLDLQAQASRTRLSGDDGLPPGADLTRSNQRASLVAQYDIDLWGRLASADDAARQRLLAQQWSRAAIEWSLTAQLAEAHYSLRAVLRQIAISEAVRTSRARTLALRETERAAGIASAFEARRAQAELALTEATLVELRRQRVTLEATLALLGGDALADAAAAPAPRSALDPAQPFDARLPAGGAAELLQRRPDLRQAEAQLAATQADIAAARAALLPALRLSGNLGSDVVTLSNLFSAPGFVWALTAGLSQSLFDGGANRARVEQAQARRDDALAQYRQAVLGAVLELREAYAALDLAEQARQAQHERVAALEHSRRLAEIGVDAGVLAPLDLLDAERNAYQAQLDEVTAYRDRLIGQVAVFKALGGGHAGLGAPTAS